MTTPEPVTGATETSRLEAATRALVRQRSQGLCDENYPNACDSCDCFHAHTKAATGHGFTMERRHAIAVLEAADAADAAAGIRRVDEWDEKCFGCHQYYNAEGVRCYIDNERASHCLAAASERVGGAS